MNIGLIALQSLAMTTRLLNHEVAHDVDDNGDDDDDDDDEGDEDDG